MPKAAPEWAEKGPKHPVAKKVLSFGIKMCPFSFGFIGHFDCEIDVKGLVRLLGTFILRFLKTSQT